MIDYQHIADLAASLKRRYPSAGPRALMEALDIGLLELPMGTQSGAIKGFIQKNNRCCTIAVNSDLEREVQDKILCHELGHYVLGHLSNVGEGFLADQSFSFRRDRSVRARKENEANFFASEFLLDTGETLSLLREYDIVTCARMLRVPVEFLDYKLRLLHQTGALDFRPDVPPVRSDCLLRIETTGIITD